MLLKLPRDSTLSVYLDFDGRFFTGDKPDLSEMKFELTDIKMRLPGGEANGSLNLEDWQNPVFTLQVDADLNVNGYEDIFCF